ncbi:MAG: DUF1653 domain-containing protein [bacterium]|nr:DUF1653 domain-containing protein [bacterium]
MEESERVERRPRAGEFYRHFKNRLYQIVTVAVHSETGEEMVVYQALYGDFRTYVRPLAMFVSEVDRKKYPHATQKYRFERVCVSGEEEEKQKGSKAVEKAAEKAEEKPAVFRAWQTKTQDKGQGEQALGGSSLDEEEEWFGDNLDEEKEANPYLMEFLSADTYEEKLRALARMRGHVGQVELDAVAMTLDIQPLRGDFQAQLDTFIKHIRTQQRYDGTRLR